MKHKEEVLELFVEWKRNIENNTRRKIKVLCSVNGGEYIVIFSYSYITMRA